ncbi:MAG TPA: ATP-dependent Clp protease ATP-binding subunit [Alphaproteobacteria bacterium]
MPDIAQATDQVVNTQRSMLLTGAEILKLHPEPLIGRRDQLKAIQDVLLRDSVNNVLMFGPGGVGMSSIARGLESLKDDLKTPHEIVNKRFMWLQVDDLMASGNGRKIIEDFEAILRRLRQDPDSVLVIDDFADFLKAAKNNGASAIINALMRDLKRHKFQACFEARLEDLGSVLKDYHSDLNENFTRVQITEPNKEELEAIAMAAKANFEKKGIPIANEAIKEGLALTTKYPRVLMLDRAQPERLLSLTDQALSEYRTLAHGRAAGIPAIEAQLAQLERASTPDAKDDNPFKSLSEAEREAKKAALVKERENLEAEWKKQQEAIREKTKKRSEFRDQRDKEQEELDDLRAPKKKDPGDKLSDVNALEAVKIDTPEMKEKAELIASLQRDIDKKTAEIKELSDLQNKGLILGVSEMRNTFSRISGIPVEDMTEDDATRLTNMEPELGKRVFGQDYAIKQVSKVIRIARAGLKEPEKPIGSFMFNGPTGVGKTELVKALAEFLYKDEHAMTRIDMSEFMEKVAVNKLIGAPPGLVGYDEGGVLTNAVRSRPDQIILLDEIDKAHPDVFNVLLQVMDAGRLTDGQGVTVDFRNTLIIMTSNLGARYFQDPTMTNDQAVGAMQALVKETFKPEFLNRIDEIIGFNSLNEMTIRQVVKKEFNKVSGYVKDQGITVEADQETMNKIAANHYESQYGGRGMVRWLKMNAKDKLADEILALPKGHSGVHLKVTYNDQAQALDVAREMKTAQPANTSTPAQMPKVA